ncbi:unnamed protein product [Candidula unifasciata]|uniref:Noggin n=1 Tax=Candidula unifasciata TaxID=100452 RepID=A0A8S3Z6G9_9EUPU|nr:unnamed protein product [Candidula unifasciata]
MKLLTLFLMMMVRASASRILSAQVSKVYFHLLKSEDQTEVDRTAETPAGSKHLPIDDLRENERNPFDPRPRDINSTFLYQHLGSRFDADYMSVRDPRNRADTATLIQLIHGRPKGRRPSYLNLLRAARVQGGSKIKLNITKGERVKLQKFLWTYTACPLKHTWKFLGVRFWPPWVKEGSCYSERSCSFPPGMTCKESSYTYKVLLRWECAQTGHFCKWRPFPYRMITNCACAC